MSESIGSDLNAFENNTDPDQNNSGEESESVQGQLLAIYANSFKIVLV